MTRESASPEPGSPASSPAIDARLETLVRENAALVDERDRYKHLADLLQKELERLRDLQPTGREHVDAAQVSLAFAEMAKELLAKTPPGDDDGAPPPDDSKKKDKKRMPHGRAVLPEHLPVETLILSAPPGEGRVGIGEEVTWRLGYRRGGFYRLKIIRPRTVLPKGEDESIVTVSLEDGDVSRVGAADVTPTAAASAPDSSAGASSRKEEACDPDRDRETTIICSAMPDEMIPRGLPTPDTLARILTAKFADKLPFRRQEGIYARERVSLSAATMCGWAERCHELARLVVDAMLEEGRSKASVIATDSTGVLVQANEKCKKGHFWVLVADADHVIFRYSQRCSSDEPKALLKGFRGTVVADASSVYDALFGLPAPPTEAGCWSHARRYFFKALPSDRELALVGIGFANKLFEVERGLAKLAPADKLRLRRERAGPVIEAFERWRDAELDRATEGSAIRRALQYSQNHWKALCRFLEDGKVPIHNNRSELELRRMVIGRANWLFVGSDDSAAWTCTFVSLVASCAMHRLDPEAYLRDLFRVLPSWPRSRVLELAPKNWNATRARLLDVEMRLPLGPVTVPAPLPADP